MKSPTRVLVVRPQVHSGVQAAVLRREGQKRADVSPQDKRQKDCTGT
jgi:hypothetical protein